MENTKHLFENGVYLISNHSVARNPMFASRALQDYFIEKMEIHLGPICKVMGYSLNDNEFQFLVRINERHEIEEYFRKKKKGQGKEVQDIPETTYIFSQAMSNLQVSFVKHFNWKYNRSGALVAGRFGRKLIEDQEEMEMWISRLNKGEKLHQYSTLWVNDLMKSKEVKTSKWIYESDFDKKNVNGNIFLDGLKPDLAGIFENHPKKHLFIKFQQSQYLRIKDFFSNKE